MSFCLAQRLDALGASLDSFARSQSDPLQIGVLSLFDRGIVFAPELL